MSAADEPGWLFANQRSSIAAQLGDGIRLFLLDPHWGVPTAGNRVRTDLEAEGVSRNRVAKALGPEAVRTPERLAGRVGAASLSGPRRVWLCHSLCELGATKMSAALDLYRSRLEEHPGEIVVLMLEPCRPGRSSSSSSSPGCWTAWPCCAATSRCLPLGRCSSGVGSASCWASATVVVAAAGRAGEGGARPEGRVLDEVDASAYQGRSPDGLGGVVAAADALNDRRRRSRPE
jgi:hypothetical protein